MKVIVKLAIEVDPQAWAEVNSSLMDADGRFKIAEVREDIRTYIAHAIQQSAVVDEAEADVSLA